MAFEKFQKERIESNEIKFHHRIPRQQLKSFSHMSSKLIKKVSNKEVILKTDEKWFGHMILVASSRKLNMQDVLKYPLGPLPWNNEKTH